MKDTLISANEAKKRIRASIRRSKVYDVWTQDYEDGLRQTLAIITALAKEKK